MSYDPKKDYLKQDPVIPGQDYAVVSFVNPKDHILSKQLHYVNNFLVDDLNKTITAQATQMARQLQVEMRSKIDAELNRLKFSVDEEDKFLYKKLDERYRKMTIDEDEFVESCRRRYEINEEEVLDKYKIYLSAQRTRLDREYNAVNSNRTSLRGFKIRGSYSSLDEARDRAKYVRDNIEPAVHAYVVQVGTWFPIDMDADEVQDQDYSLSQLNELMGKYHEGSHARDKFYQERKREMVDGAQTENAKNATKNRLQAKLREKRNEKFRNDLSALEKLTTDTPKLDTVHEHVA
jgi:hypothetical protein